MHMVYASIPQIRTQVVPKTTRVLITVDETTYQLSIIFCRGLLRIFVQDLRNIRTQTLIRMPTYTVTPTMSLSIAEKLNQTIRDEPWTLGRTVIINEASNTISLFHRHGSESLVVRQHDIPLRYHGVPVIPHHFPASVNPLKPAPSELEDSVALSRVDGLSNA